MGNIQSSLRGRLRGAKGFTFVEVVATLLIIGIIAVAAISSGGISLGAAVVAESEALKNQLRFAQNRSMSTKDAWGISSSASQYRLFRYDPDSGATTNMTLPGLGTDVANLSADGFSVSSFTISFDDWGRPCSDATGTTAHTSNQTVTVSKSGESRTITITKNTGFIQ